MATRTIPIPLRPKTPDETVRDKWEDVIWEETRPLQEALVIWGAANRETLRTMRDLDMPGELHNRTREIWRPLRAIADLAGKQWPERSRKAAIALDGARSQQLDHRVLLLADIRDTFDAAKADRVHTRDILGALVEIEERPWRGWWLDSYGGALKTEAAYKLARILKEYGIDPEPNAFQVGMVRGRGYAKAAFESAWKQYLPALPAVISVPSVQCQAHSHPDRTKHTRSTEGRHLPQVTATPPHHAGAVVWHHPTDRLESPGWGTTPDRERSFSGASGAVAGDGTDTA